MNRLRSPLLRFSPLALGVLVLHGAVTPVFSQEDTPEVRWYDVRALEAAGLVDPPLIDLRLSMESAFLDSLEPDDYDVRHEDLGEGNSAELPDIVLDALGEEWPDSSVFIDSRAGFLRVEGNEQTHAEVSSVLAELTVRMLRTAKVEVFVLPTDSLPDGVGAVLGPGEVDALLEATTPTDYFVKTVRLGRGSRIGTEGNASVLLDYDVEVAQHARAADPQVSILREGLELGVLVQDLLEGGLLLRTWGRQGAKVGDPRTVSMGLFDASMVELPSVASTLAVSSASIENGGGLLVQQDWNDNGAWLVRVHASAQNPQSPFIPLGSLTAAPLVEPPPTLPRTSPSGGWHHELPPMFEELGNAAHEVAYTSEDVLDQILDERRDEPQGSLFLVGDALYVRGAPELLEDSRKLVRELGNALSPTTIEMDVRLDVLSREAARRLLREKGPAEIAAELPHRMLGAARTGDSLLLVGGLEKAYLQDHDVEIAQAAAIADPIIGNVFEGVSFWCRVQEVGAGKLAGWVDMEVQMPTGAPRSVGVAVWKPLEPGNSSDEKIPTGTFVASGVIEKYATARARVRSMMQFGKGEWTVVGCSTLAGSDRAVLAVARLSSVGD